ncbi:MAG: hypothetical protein JHC84_09845 [Solirubrobacteraceae bacterium]|nr:hypothetical protein [Solirubrobacteraceae bacterium]
MAASPLHFEGQRIPVPKAGLDEGLVRIDDPAQAGADELHRSGVLEPEHLAGKVPRDAPGTVDVRIGDRDRNDPVPRDDLHVEVGHGPERTAVPALSAAGRAQQVACEDAAPARFSA